jgi:stalled ribosome rescue protein Dom34
MTILTRKQFQDDMAKMWSEAVHAEYKAQIEAAVLAEREACAKLCESLWRIDGQHSADEFAAEIRARGQA